MNQNIPTWKKILYPILALLAMPVISLISIFTVPTLTDTWTEKMTTTEEFFNYSFMFLFATFATYYLMVFLAKIVKPQNRWEFVSRVFWGYTIVSGVIFWLNYIDLTSDLFVPIHMASFGSIMVILEWDVSRIKLYTYAISTISTLSLLIIYLLLRKKFKTS